MSEIYHRFSESEEMTILNEAEKSITELGKFIQETAIVDLYGSIKYSVNNINNFYFLVNKVEKNEEKINNKFYISLLGFNLCCLKKEYKNNDDIEKKINDFEEKKKTYIDDKLINIRNEYINENPHQVINIFSKISKKAWIFIIISFFHFLAMTEVEGILFSIFGEIRRTLHLEDKKTFYDFLEKSTFNDSAQINFNYFFSFLCPYFINSNKLNKTYIISSIVIFIFFLVTSSLDFLKEVELNQDMKIDWGRISVLSIIYLVIYFCASLISLLPQKILIKESNYSCLHIILISGFMTLGVIAKNIIHHILKIYHKNSSIIICSIIFLCSWILFIIIFNLINHYFQYDNNNSDLEGLLEYNNIGFEKNELNMKVNSANFNLEMSQRINTNARNNDKNIHIIYNNKSLINYDIDFNNIKNKVQPEIDENDDDIEKEDIASMVSYESIALPNIDFEDHNRVKELIKTDGVLEKKKFYTLDYFCCFLKISFDNFIFLIKVKNFKNYILQLAKNRKFRFIIYLNLLSRAQKLKSKEIYKKDFDGSLFFHILNFFLSYGISSLVLLFYYKIQAKKNLNKCIELREKERFIIKIIGIDCLLMLIFSFLSFTNLSFFSFSAICISGNINFFFYEYYSTQQIDYTSLSGYISFGQLIFRLIELCFHFEDILWYLGQAFCSLLAIIFCLLYYQMQLESITIY